MNYKKILYQALNTILVITVVSATFSSFTRAEQTGDKINYSFTGTMIHSTPCAVNGDQPVTVTFGNVGISKIDTGRYVQELKYTLNCGGATSTDKVTLLIRATPAVWDEKAIATSVPELGVRILDNSNPLELNARIVIPDPSNPPALQVLLLKQPGAELTEQDFTATGTLVVEYV
ncbi:fimbrial protein [Cronobacter turicensis]|nr:fimbrial protein [Cronobacter turicensis]